MHAMKTPLISAALAALLLAACSGGSDDAATPSGTPPRPAPSASPGAEAAATPFPTLPAGTASFAACPLNDAAFCRLAIAFQDALNAGNVEPIVSITEPRSRLCRDTFWALEDDIGCSDPVVEGQQSDPVVFLLFSGGDCCAMSPARFQDQLQRWVAESADAPPWRLYAAVTGAALWEGDPAVMIVNGTAPASRFIEIAITPGVEPRVRGAIVGTFFTGPYVFPPEQLIPWP
jgi:hypothetical protein